jgi:hypothetical protein
MKTLRQFAEHSQTTTAATSWYLADVTKWHRIWGKATSKYKFV